MREDKLIFYFMQFIYPKTVKFGKPSGRIHIMYCRKQPLHPSLLCIISTLNLSANVDGFMAHHKVRR